MTADMEEKHPTSRHFLHPPSDEEFSVSQSCRPPLPACETTTDIPGLKAYLTTFGAFTALFFTFGKMNAFGTFQAWYSTHQLAGVPASTISWIGSLQLWIFFFLVSYVNLFLVSAFCCNATQQGYPIGRLFDMYGPTHLMTLGTAFYFASIMLTSVCEQYYQYVLAQGILFGLGVGLL